jgi:hypothetical protein
MDCLGSDGERTLHLRLIVDLDQRLHPCKTNPTHRMSLTASLGPSAAMRRGVLGVLGCSVVHLTIDGYTPMLRTTTPHSVSGSCESAQ